MHIMRTTEKKNGPIWARRICRQRIRMSLKYSEIVRSLQVSDIAFAFDGWYIAQREDSFYLKLLYAQKKIIRTKRIEYLYSVYGITRSSIAS
jgi:hypothetical protein